MIKYSKENSSTVTTFVNSEQNYDQTLQQVYSVVEPNVIHIRPGANSNDLKKEITEQLSKIHEYYNLDINSLIRDENERRTAIGQEIH